MASQTQRKENFHATRPLQGKQAVTNQSSTKRRALGDIGNDAKPRNQLSAKKATQPLGNATKKESNPARQTVIDYDCEIEKPSFPLTAIDEEEEFIPPNIFSNVKTRVTLDMSLRAISSNSNPLNLVDPNWEPNLLELIGSKGSQDDLTLYPITEEHNQESDECNQLRLSDIDLEI